MRKLFPAIVFTLTLGLTGAATDRALAQTPNIRVGPLAEEPRPNGDGEAANGANGEKSTGGKQRNETAKNGPAQPATNPGAGETDAPPPAAPTDSRANNPSARPEAKPAGAGDPANPSTNGPAATDKNVAAGERVSAAAAPATPPAAPPLTAIYRIGTGDVLDIRVLNMTDSRQSTLFTVLAGGVLEYPLLRNPLTVAGMTTEELSAQLVAELRHRGVYDRPQVRVSVREYASHAVLVSGLANDPGTKILRREAVPLYVVVAESQPRPEAGRAVIISHKSGQTLNVDLDDPAALSVLVQAGDVINLVPRPPAFFYVGGEIGSPGQKEFHSGMTLTQALLAAGGVTRAAGPKVKVSRQGVDGRLVSTEYDLPEIENGLSPDPGLRPGDRVEVSRGRGKAKE